MSRRKKQKSQTNQVTPQTEMMQRFESILDAEDFDRLQNELDKPYHPAIRINPLKSEDMDFIGTLRKRYQWETVGIPYCPNGFWITNSSQSISKTVEHSLGQYYIQDAASMLPVELFDFSDREKPLILDMAASPGGKTTHLVSRTNDRGLVIANDSSRSRLPALRTVLQNWGTSHAAISNFPGDHFGSWFPETFDAILLDAPCSMQGLRATDSHPLRPISQKEIDSLARRQSRLLASAIHALKPGGQVVYSTCTLTPEENEGVLDQILTIFSDTIQIDPLDQLIPIPVPGLSSYQEKIFAPQVKKAARIWPFSFGTAGFFAARLTKLSSYHSKTKTAPGRPLSQAGWFALDEENLKDLHHQLQGVYGFSFYNLLEEHDLQVWRFKDSLHLFPGIFLSRFPDFPVQSLGLALGEISGSYLSLAHDFATRFGNLISRNIYGLDAEQIVGWMHGEDLVVKKLEGNNEFLFIIKDQLERVIGTGKYSSERMRNLLPKRILISGDVSTAN